MHTFKSKVTQHRGNSRVWIEGPNLSNHGFHYHTEYFVEFLTTGQINMYLSQPSGVPCSKRRVSGRKRAGQTEFHPIIDLCSKRVTQTLKGAEYVTITISDSGYISVMPANTLRLAA